MRVSALRAAVLAAVLLTLGWVGMRLIAPLSTHILAPQRDHVRALRSAAAGGAEEERRDGSDHAFGYVC